MSPLLQSQKLRDVFNMDFPDNNFLMKTLTVVSGPDMVDLTFHNFVSYKENVGKVHGDTWLGAWHLGEPGLPERQAWAPGGRGGGAGTCKVSRPDGCALGACRTGLKTCWLWSSTL